MLKWLKRLWYRNLQFKIPIWLYEKFEQYFVVRWWENYINKEMQKIKRKTLLYKSGVEYADYCLNHVEGCSHGCKFP